MALALAKCEPYWTGTGHVAHPRKYPSATSNKYCQDWYRQEMTPPPRRFNAALPSRHYSGRERNYVLLGSCTASSIFLLYIFFSHSILLNKLFYMNIQNLGRFPSCLTALACLGDGQNERPALYFIRSCAGFLFDPSLLSALRYVRIFHVILQ